MTVSQSDSLKNFADGVWILQIGIHTLYIMLSSLSDAAKEAQNISRQQTLNTMPFTKLPK